MGIPAHPLMVHAAVVFVPLLALLAAAYAFVPKVRPHTRWVLGAIALIAPVVTTTAKLSGEAFYARLEERKRVSPEYVPKLDAHGQFGEYTLYVVLVLALLTLALVYLVPPAAAATTGLGANTVLMLVLRVLVVVAGVISLYYVVRTGDSGAQAVWSGS